jgi:chitodextrinase
MGKVINKFVKFFKNMRYFQWVVLLVVIMNQNIFAADYVAKFEPSTGVLIITFGDGDDVAQLTVDYSNGNLLLIQTDFMDESAMPEYLLVNGSKTISFGEVKELYIYMGGGDDNFFEPMGNFPLIKLYGGDGDDFLKTPAGAKLVYVYGGKGNDLILTEHSRNCFLFGEDGDDTLWGSSDGTNVLDGGLGANIMYTYVNTWNASTEMTIMHHQGANDMAFDSRSPTRYKFVPDLLNTSAVGSLYISETVSGGQDVLDFSDWNRAINFNLDSTALQKVSVDGSGLCLLSITQTYANRIEQIIQPTKIITPDTIAPTIPSALVASSITATFFSISWTASTDAVGVKGYKVFKNGVQIGTSTTTTFLVSNLIASTNYSMTVSAYDAASNNSALSIAKVVTTSLAPDTIAPSTPNTLNASSITSTSFILSWSASTDAVGVKGYKIFKNGVQIGTSSTTSISVISLSASTNYSMTVSAFDAAGNNSNISAAKIVTTAPAPDTSGPAIGITTVTINGTVSDSSGIANVKVNGVAVLVGVDGKWKSDIALVNASTSISISTTDTVGNITNKTLTITK